jgi:hypothetical protein
VSPIIHRLLSVQRALAAAALAVLMVRCSASPSGPGSKGPAVFAVSPAEGLLTGGTPIQISGANFGPNAVVTIGGVLATDIVVESVSTITAKTGPAAPGVVDVAVTVDGKTGTLSGGFKYLPVSGEPPVIASIAARGMKANEPLGFADAGEEITLTANVTDADTAADQLHFEWHADVGTISDSGAVVRWAAPADAPTPSPANISVTVSDNTGNSAVNSTIVTIHNSVKEVGDLAREFLLDFSDSSKPAAFVVRNFSKSPRCEPGRDEEFSDVDRNRHEYHIDSSEIRSPVVNFQFGGFPCSYAPQPGDACAAVPSAWESTCIAGASGCKPGEKSTVRGVDYVTASYEGTEWKLCASYFSGEGALRSNFIR